MLPAPFLVQSDSSSSDHGDADDWDDMAIVRVCWSRDLVPPDSMKESG